MSFKTSARLGLVYPNENNTDWYAVFESFVSQMDGVGFAAREDRNIALMTSGLVTWDASSSTFTFPDLSIISTLTGLRGTVSAGSITIADGQAIYVNLTRHPNANYSIALQAATSAGVPENDSSFLVAVRMGEQLWVRGAGVLCNRYAGPLTREPLVTVPDPGNGASVTLITSPFSRLIPMAIGTGAETMSVGNPAFNGQALVLYALTVGGGGSRAVTFSTAIDQAGSTQATFNAVADQLVLQGFQLNGSTLRWRVMQSTSVAFA